MDPRHRRFCCHCRGEIPEKRLRRGSNFCSPECAQNDRNARRRYLGQFHCRQCGRPMRPGNPSHTRLRLAHDCSIEGSDRRSDSRTEVTS
jgi:hypothetical protein